MSQHASVITPRPAATLVLLRDGRQGPEVFMLRRNTRSTFVGGAHVFPGGGVDEADRHPDVLALCHAFDDQTASARLGMSDGGLAYWVAAIRECFEEAGVLLACDNRGEYLQDLPPRLHERLDDYRSRVMAGELALASLCHQEQLGLATSQMHYFSHWITPEGLPRRYDTRFFLAAAPAGQEGSACQQETVDQCWLRPAEALDQWRRQHIDLVFPTVKTLEELASFDTTDAALTTIGKRASVDAVQPRIRQHMGGTRVLLPGEPGYDD